MILVYGVQLGTSKSREFMRGIFVVVFHFHWMFAIE
jgi:hypothetical protein